MTTVTLTKRKIMHQEFGRDDDDESKRMEQDRREAQMIREMFGTQSPFLERSEVPEQADGVMMRTDDGKMDVTLF